MNSEDTKKQLTELKEKPDKQMNAIKKAMQGMKEKS
jgi:hypothetical protein